MPKIPGYERQVSATAGATIDLPRADPRAFGGQIGAALEGAGQDLARRTLRAEAEAEDAERLKAQAAYAKTRAEALKFRQEARNAAAADGAGHREAVLADFDKRRELALGQVSNPRVRQQLETQFETFRSELDLDEDGYVAGLKATKVAGDTQAAIELDANSLYTDGRAETLAADVARWQQTIDALGVPAAVKVKLGAYARNRLSRSLVEGMAERDPYAARELLKSGALNAMIDADSMTAIGNRIDSEIRGREAQQRALEAQARAERRAAEAEARRAAREAQAAAEARIRDAADYMAAGGAIGPEDAASLAATAARLGNPGLARRVAMLGEKNQVQTVLRGATPREVQDTINAISAELAKGGPNAPLLKAQLDAATDMKRAQDAGLRSDPLSYAASQGVVELPPLDLGQVGSASVRLMAANKVRARYGGPLTVLTDEEAAEYAARIHGGDANQKMAALRELRQFSPAGAAAAMRQIGKSRPVEARAGALLSTAGGARTARLILDGMTVIRDDKMAAPKTDAYPVAREELGRALRFLPELQQQIPDAARAYYAGWKLSEGEGGFDDTHFRQSVNAVAGGVRGQDGVMRGGLGERQGHKVLLPDGMTEDKFNEVLDRATTASWPAAEKPVWADGSPVTDAQLRRMRPFAIGGGRYVLAADADGAELVMRRDGRPFTVELK